MYVCMYACMHACMYVCTWTIASYILDISADPGPSHGRGGAWDHLWCGPWLFPIYAPIASIAIAFRLPSVQTLRGTSIVPFRNCRTHPALGPPNAPNAPRQHLFCTALKLPDTVSPSAHRTLQTLPGSASALDRLQLAIPPTPPGSISIATSLFLPDPTPVSWGRRHPGVSPFYIYIKTTHDSGMHILGKLDMNLVHPVVKSHIFNIKSLINWHKIMWTLWTSPFLPFLPINITATMLNDIKTPHVFPWKSHWISISSYFFVVTFPSSDPNPAPRGIRGYLWRGRIAQAMDKGFESIAADESSATGATKEALNLKVQLHHQRCLKKRPPLRYLIVDSIVEVLLRYCWGTWYFFGFDGFWSSAVEIMLDFVELSLKS